LFFKLNPPPIQGRPYDPSPPSRTLMPLPLKSARSTQLVSARGRRERVRAFAVALLASTIATAAAIAATPAHAATPHRATPSAEARLPFVTLTKVTVDGSTIKIAGHVRLPVNSAKERRRTVIWLTLTGNTGATRKSETFTAKLNDRDSFTATHTTKLAGALGLDVLVKIAGKIAGRKTIHTVNITAPGGSNATGTSVPGTATSGSSTSGASKSGSSGSGSSASGSEPAGPPSALNGTFELTPGAYDAGTGAVSGSWFEMFDKDQVPLENNNSPLGDTDYTPLLPGADGGLQTFAYQPRPSPAFSGPIIGGKETGSALASAIMQPQSFFGWNFSTVTEEIDPQTAAADPKPEIIDDDGQLSGQITAWSVGWNGEWFNQGSPKPNAAEPYPEGTKALTGTYDAATGHFVLEWQSLIVGGEFKEFRGFWHLEGTFVSSS
jgi:hypothetical protein